MTNLWRTKKSEQWVKPEVDFLTAYLSADSPEITNAQMANMEIHHAFPQSLGWRFQSLGLTGEQIHSRCYYGNAEK